MTNGQQVSTYSSDLNLQEFVKNATWRELLVELVETNKLDPWDIDIIKVVDSYITAIKKMQVMDLHIPANIILAASILLRMKSESINVTQLDEVLDQEEPVQTERIIPDVPTLIPRLRLQPKRKITLNELMDALGDAIKINERRVSVIKQRAEPISIVVEKDDIDEKIRIAYNLVKDNVDKEGVTTFARLSSGFGGFENILLSLFVPLLFLAHKGEVVLMQDQFFNEIFVKLGGDGGNGRKAD
jgi:segregation and condensation protein A